MVYRRRRYRRYRPTRFKKRTYRRRYVPRRRTYRKKTFKRRRRSIYKGSWSTIPYRQWKIFKYQQFGFRLNVGGGNPTTSICWFSGNSPYDPYETGIGTTAYNWGHWADLFSNYRVSSSTIYVDVNTTSTPHRTKVCVFPMDTDSAGGTFTWHDISNRPGSKVFNIAGINTMAFGRFRIKCTWTTRKAFLDHPKDADQISSWNASPTNQWWWGVGIYNPEDNEQSIIFDTQIYYTTECINRDKAIDAAAAAAANPDMPTLTEAVVAIGAADQT